MQEINCSRIKICIPNILCTADERWISRAMEGRKYPRWAQDSDWPFSESGKPMKYISQRNVDSETIELTFEDVDTGKRSTVIDIY